MRLLRLTAAAATSAAALTLALLGPAAAWADEATPSAPSASTSDASMSGMDMGSMPGMDHDATPMPGMDHDTTPMPGMEHEHGSTTPSSRPRALVLGGFVLVNGTGMVTALVLRRRSRHERDRKRAAKQQAGSPSRGSRPAANDAAAAVTLEGASR
mgnify:CR=1 FL=1